MRSWSRGIGKDKYDDPNKYVTARYELSVYEAAYMAGTMGQCTECSMPFYAPDLWLTPQFISKHGGLRHQLHAEQFASVGTSM